MIVELVKKVDGVVSDVTVELKQQWCCNDLKEEFVESNTYLEPLKRRDGRFGVSVARFKDDSVFEMHLEFMVEDYDEWTPDQMRIHFCPFCGEKFDFKVVRAIEVKRVVVKETVEKIQIQEVEIPL